MPSTQDRIFRRPCVSCGLPISSTPCFLIRLTASGVELTDISGCGGHEYEGRWHEVAKLLKSSTKGQPHPPNGFLIHHCCWPLLSKLFKSGEFCLEKLFETLRARSLQCHEDMRSVTTMDFASKPPTFAQCFRRVGFHIAARALPETKGPYGIRGSSINSHYFERIPLEIRLEIAAYLPTVDFLNLRLCSRAMADIFEEQIFWKTRFFIHGDRGYLAFLTEGIQCAEDWRLIYRCTHKFLKPNTELRARRQHWRQNRWLRNACIMTRGQNLLLSRVDIEWQKAASGMNCGRNTRRSINHKCQRCYGKHSPLTQSVPFSRAVVGLAISLLPDLRSDADLGETFIAGLELIYPSDTPNTVLGYRLPGNQIMIDLQERPLRGFQLIIEKGGVRAILPLFSANDWIGKPFVEFNGSCSLVRISTDNEILALSADFDYCKLTSLAIGTGKSRS